MTASNPMADALGAGVGRRRQPGETAGAGPAPISPQSGERRVAVDVPRGLYTEVKVLAAQSGLTVKQIMVAGLRTEVERLRSGSADS